MCIIVAKKKGVELPTREVLETCFDNNSHGAGLMYTFNNQVVIEKGFMNFTEFNARLEYLNNALNLIDKNVVMHFRISTSGLVDQGNCHPYPITTIDNELRELNLTTELGMVHNGIISKYIPEKGSVLNDTQTFIKNFVYSLQVEDRDFLKNDYNLKLLEFEAGSKLCFLDKDDNLYTVGKFTEEEGVLYSNDSYVPWDYAYTWDDIYTNDYFYDISDLENISLDEDIFYYLLDNSYIPSKGIVIDSTGKTYDNDGNICIDNYDNIFRIDWNARSFKCIGELSDII